MVVGQLTISFLSFFPLLPPSLSPLSFLFFSQVAQAGSFSSARRCPLGLLPLNVRNSWCFFSSELRDALITWLSAHRFKKNNEVPKPLCAYLVNSSDFASLLPAQWSLGSVLYSPSSCSQPRFLLITLAFYLCGHTPDAGSRQWSPLA